jgi:hypothetical protein
VASSLEVGGLSLEMRILTHGTIAKSDRLCFCWLARHRGVSRVEKNNRDGF